MQSTSCIKLPSSSIIPFASHPSSGLKNNFICHLMSIDEKLRKLSAFLLDAPNSHFPFRNVQLTQIPHGRHNNIHNSHVVQSDGTVFGDCSHSARQSEPTMS